MFIMWGAKKKERERETIQRVIKAKIVMNWSKEKCRHRVK